MQRLDTLASDDLARELEQLRTSDPVLSGKIVELRGGKAKAGSFMQTRMPGSGDIGNPSLANGTKVDVWQITELLGSGGMGEVYRAQRADGLFEQQVALKIAKTKTAAFKQKFDAERQRLAQLEHPNIARIVDGGSARRGASYMTMEFVDGQPIDGFAKAKGLGRNARLGLIEKLCAAVAHAHGRLVLHRDIKHDNVLINSDGELRLIDFGVASLIEDTVADTSSGPLTLAYAAPEQLRGEPVSAAIDIFAIGMLAHLLETGALPKRQSAGGVAIDRVGIEDEDLAAILAKATADDPMARYGSADALGDDLQKFAGGFPVAARPASSVTRFKKMVGRNKFASAMSGAAVAALVAGVIGVSVFAVRASEEAEANRIAQQKGANTIEFYETFNAGFIEFATSVDAQTPQGQAIFDAINKLEEKAQSLEASDPQKALEAYVFLAEFYADAGQDQAATRLGETLAQQASELTYPSAFTLSSLVHISEGMVQTDKLITLLDRLNTFFSKDSVVHSFDIAQNRCVKARLTRADRDERSCLERATQHLGTIDTESYAVASGNLPLRAYAMESARRIEALETAEQIGREALEFYRGEERPAPVPEASFLIGLSDIAQMESEWDASQEHLQSALGSLEDAAPAPYLEVAVNMELAQTQFALERFADAQESASRAAQKASNVFGSEHYQVRDARSEIARARAMQGEREVARQMLREIIEAEAAGDNDPAALKRYRGMLERIPAN